jgi:hypothetical protein
MSEMSSSELAPIRRGRPRKFARPSSSVTLTLPNDVIAALHGVDRDLGRAVVRLMQPRMEEPPRPAAELTSFGDRAVIVVPRTPQLGARTGVELVPFSDGRALISFDERLSVPQIELRVGDALEDAALAAPDRAVFEALADILRNARRSESMVLRQRSIIILQRARPRARAAAAAGVRPARPARRPRN